MKTPTIEQVKEHFKNAKLVEYSKDKTVAVNLDTIRSFKYFNIKGYCMDITSEEGDFTSVILWDSKSGYVKIIYPKQERPNINHKHTKGDWFADCCIDEYNDIFQNVVFTSKHDSIGVATCFGLSEEECEANIKLIAAAPKLLQIAEMYFDSMKGTDAEGSLPFNLTLETLNSLK